MIEKFTSNFFIALEALSFNKLRSLLTSLGIIFGVASVIAMLAIGKGAEQEILSQIQLLGSSNIIITPIVEQVEGSVAEAEVEGQTQQGQDGQIEKKPFSPGLTLKDARSIVRLVPGVDWVSPETVVETIAIQGGIRRSTKLVGVDRTYFEGSDFEIAFGQFFSQNHMARAAPVCVIGSDIRTRFFPRDNPLGKQIKVGRLWLTVIGVLKSRDIAEKSLERLGIRNFDLDIYTPIQTLLLRYENRAQLTADDLNQARRNRNRNQEENRNVNYHQLDRLVVRVASTDHVQPVAEVISRMLERRHYGVVDYEVIIPEALLKQEQQTQYIFNIVLAAIASISLLVGGIGIMNIMLASVLERIKEIGIRRSVGATRKDVIQQFLIEAITISVSGGLIGVLLGVLFSYGIEWSTEIVTVISIPAVILAFLVSIGIGLTFGLWPARRAAELDPVVALRYE